jgi:polyhydroxyalkanoate synthesis regulator protein
MEAFRRNQAQFRSAMEGAFSGGPFAEIAKRNMAMLEAAAGAFKPGGIAVPGVGAATEESTPKAGDDLAALKAQLATLQDKIDKMGK